MSLSTTYPYSAKAECQHIKQFSFSAFNAIHDIAEEVWNKFIPPANLLMQHAALQLLEINQEGKMQFKYVLVKKNDTPLGIIYFQIIRFTGHDVLNYLPQEPASGIKKHLYKIARFFIEPIVLATDVKLLVSGNIFMTGENGFYFQQDIDKGMRASLLRGAINEIAKADKRIKGALFTDLYEPKTDFDTYFKKRGYNELTVESDMSIALNSEWKTFDDYLNAFSSKYRVRARKTFALCIENKVEQKDLSLEEITLHEDRLFDLYEQVMSRADFKLATLGKNYFSLHKKEMPEHYKVFAYFRNNEMIGFISLFHIGKKIEVHYTGMEKEHSKQTNLYQKMLYDVIKYGIEHRVEKLHLGRTAPEIKSTFGATPSPMYGYLKAFNPLINYTIVKLLTANLKPKEYIIRNPFKTTL